MSDLAPIALFVFNRPEHTRMVLSHLLTNAEADASDLYVFSDGSRHGDDVEKVAQVRAIVRATRGFRSVTMIERGKNLGLAKSVIDGLNQIFAAHKKAVVMEDDIVTAKNFLRFMNDALEYYCHQDKIFCISGYSFPIVIPPTYREEVYAFYRACSWGWGTWADRWNSVDWDLKGYPMFRNSLGLRRLLRRGGSDLNRQLRLSVNGKRDSWFMAFQFSCSMQERLCVYPVLSKAKNIGTDGSGKHFRHRTRRFDVELDATGSATKLTPLSQVNSEVGQQLRRFFSLKNRMIVRLIDLLEGRKESAPE